MRVMVELLIYDDLLGVYAWGGTDDKNTSKVLEFVQSRYFPGSLPLERQRGTDLIADGMRRRTR